MSIDIEGMEYDVLHDFDLKNNGPKIVNHAALLVDNEGGMVHLRHALRGGSSVVLFGPTSKAVFGYPENENISSSVCDHWCEWQIPDWQYVCARLGTPGHPCMDAIRTEDVLAAVHRVLDGRVL